MVQLKARERIYVRSAALIILQTFQICELVNRDVARGGPGCPFVSHFLSKQPTTGGKNEMKIW